MNANASTLSTNAIKHSGRLLLQILLVLYTFGLFQRVLSDDEPDAFHGPLRDPDEEAKVEALSAALLKAANRLEKDPSVQDEIRRQMMELFKDDLRQYLTTALTNSLLSTSAFKITTLVSQVSSWFYCNAPNLNPPKVRTVFGTMNAEYTLYPSIFTGLLAFGSLLSLLLIMNQATTLRILQKQHTLNALSHAQEELQHLFAPQQRTPPT